MVRLLKKSEPAAWVASGLGVVVVILVVACVEPPSAFALTPWQQSLFVMGAVLSAVGLNVAVGW